MTATVTARTHPAVSQRAQAIAVEGDAVDGDGRDGDDGPSRLQRGHAGEDAGDDEREHGLRAHGGATAAARRCRPRRGRRAATGPRHRALQWPSASAAAMSTRTSGSSRVSAALRTRAHRTVKVPAGRRAVVRPRRGRGAYCRGEYERRSRTAAGAGRSSSRRPTTRRAAVRSFQGVPDPSSKELPTCSAHWQNAASDGHAGSSSERWSTFVVAAVLGGPVAGRLDSANGFEDPGSSSVAAREAIQQASGLDGCTGSHRGGRHAGRRRSAQGRERVAQVARVLDGIPGVAVVRTPAGAGARAGGARTGHRRWSPRR